MFWRISMSAFPKPVEMHNCRVMAGCSRMSQTAGHAHSGLKMGVSVRSGTFGCTTLTGLQGLPGKLIGA